ncbi:unnamed protein product [Cochlearia groenlandica]
MSKAQQNQMVSLSFSSQMSREDEEMARSGFRAKEDEIEKRKTEELETVADPIRKEMSWVRKKIDSVNKELKPLGATVQKKNMSLNSVSLEISEL